MKSINSLYDEIYFNLKNEINSSKGMFIPIDKLFSVTESINRDMPGFLQGPQGQASFYDAIMRLVSEQFIAPVGQKPNTPNGLYKKYRVNKNRTNNESANNEITSQIIRSIPLPATIDYYLKNRDDFINDKNIIDTISDFLRKGKCETAVTANERAYMLFGDEKFFKGDDKNRSRGETVLKRLGLNYSQLGCYETVEPFFSFVRKDFYSKSSRNILIIENKDTFWSFKNSMMNPEHSLRMDMLIYGEGKKIISSFMFIGEYDVDPEKDTFFYFGDLDFEGINIFCELCDKYPQYRIIPFYKAYQSILEIGLQRGLQQTPKQQAVNEKNLTRFVGLFDFTNKEKLEKLLKDGFYIPQEALSAIEIKERFESA